MKYLFLLFPLFIACSRVNPVGTFDNTKRPSPPDYTNEKYWAALPTKQDNADLTPPSLKNEQDNAAVDVFFLYPTVYTGSKRYQTNWNAPVDYAPFNKAVDDTPIKFQASIFNNVGKIYAPRYRQAHIACYFMKDKEDSRQKAFDLGYEDVKNAFEYYLSHYNNGRPIIIVGHSQGSSQGMRLVKEYFDGKPLQKQLVAAYLLGMPIPKDYFKNIAVCDNPDQTECFCAWRTFKKGYVPTKFPTGKQIAVVNPLTWKTDENYAAAELNTGGVTDFKKIRNHIVDAQIHDGVLWAKKPKFPGSFLLRTPNYHPGDLNLFYMNIRENAALRTNVYLKR